MGKALDEFNARLAGIKSDISFVAAAARFRPYCYGSLDANVDPEIRTLAQNFANIKDSTTEGIYGALAIRLAASLERYQRSMLQESLSEIAAKAGIFSKIPKKLASRNVTLTGRLLAYSENPRDHLKVDVSELIKNLASCAGDTRAFALNLQAFSATVSGVSDESIEQCLAILEITDFWDSIFNDSKLQQLLEARRTPDAKKSGIQKMKDLSRWRNNWAHGGDDEASLTEDELVRMSIFIGRLVEVVDAMVKTRLRRR